MEESINDPSTFKKRTLLCVLVVLTIIGLDQWLKIWVKTHMGYGDEFKIMGLDWARIHFVENDGMAFGISLGGSIGKLLLSSFRIIAVGFLIYILYRLIKSKENWGLLVCFSLILAGAIGNILDSAFYGLFFTESFYQGGLAEYAPDRGYAPFLFGRVVDMFYFPLIDTRWPDWVPLVGGSSLQFFRPVFNVADAAISTGVISLIIFFRSFFKTQTNTPINATTTVEQSVTSEMTELPDAAVEDLPEQTQ